MFTPQIQFRPQRSLRRSVRAALGLVVAGLAVAACDDYRAPIEPPSPEPWTGERVLTAAGTSLQVRIDRSLSAPQGPAFVLLSGLDTPLEVWQSVRSELAAHGTVFSYDRGGVGRSGAVGPLRPSAEVASELHAALNAAGVRKPVVLVAHSIAGLHARVFANRYPGNVAGIVLLDATHESVLEMLDPETVEAIARDQRFPGAQAEVRAQAQSVTQVRSAPLPNVPLLVLTSMRPEAGDGPGTRDWLAELQAEWLTQVTRAEQQRLPVGHMIMLEAPDAVVEAARRVTSLGAASGATAFVGERRSP